MLILVVITCIIVEINNSKLEAFLLILTVIKLNSLAIIVVIEHIQQLRPTVLKAVYNNNYDSFHHKQYWYQCYHIVDFVPANIDIDTLNS